MDTNRSNNTSLIISGLLMLVFAGFYYYNNPDMWLNESIPEKYVIDIPVEDVSSVPAQEVLGESNENLPVNNFEKDIEVYTFVVDDSEVAIMERDIVSGISAQVTLINEKTIKLVVENDKPVITIDGVEVEVNKMPYEAWLDTNTTNGIIWEFN